MYDQFTRTNFAIHFSIKLSNSNIQTFQQKTIEAKFRNRLFVQKFKVKNMHMYCYIKNLQNLPMFGTRFILQYRKLKLVSWPTIIEEGLEASFSKATSSKCREGRNSFPWISPLTRDTYLIMLSVKLGGIKYHFLCLCITRPGIEFWSSGPWASALIIILASLHENSVHCYDPETIYIDSPGSRSGCYSDRRQTLISVFILKILILQILIQSKITCVFSFLLKI